LVKKRFGYNFLKTINKINNSIRIDSFTEELPDDMHIRAFDYFDEKILKLIEEVEVNYNFISDMSINYFNWRYCDERGGKYIKFRLFSGDKTLGIIILGIKRGEGFIANLLAKKEDTTVIYHLLKKALEFFESNSINAARILAIKGHPYEKILKSCDFIDNRSERYIDYIFLDDKSKKIEPGTPSNILFQYGDTDWI
jgi:hypothetical protein